MPYSGQCGPSGWCLSPVSVVQAAENKVPPEQDIRPSQVISQPKLVPFTAW